MSASTPRPLEEAATLAASFVRLIRPSTEVIELAGSIRRAKPEVRDIEIVVQPTWEAQLDMFDHPGEPVNLLRRTLHTLPGVTVLKDGDRYQQVRYAPPGFEPVTVDLFSANPCNWGYILALRTGSAEFSRWLVTPRVNGGARPDHISFRDGYVYRDGVLIDLPTEESFFGALGVRPVSPGLRTLEILRPNQRDWLLYV